VAHKLLPPMVR